jgi:hypothetical protein
MIKTLTPGLEVTGRRSGNAGRPAPPAAGGGVSEALKGPHIAKIITSANAYVHPPRNPA